jgi:digeranylgeranylglycerophospholipid reductase
MDEIKEHYDCIVVGVGPAGSTFSRIAAKGGMEVLAVDKRKDIGAPVRCGEGFGAHHTKFIDAPIPGMAIAYNIEGAKVISPSGSEITIKNEETKGFVLERRAFDKFLAFRAGAAGAHIRTKTHAINLLKEGNKITGVKLRTPMEELEVRADLVISAEGMENRLAREAGFGRPAFPLYEVDSCFEYEMVNVACEPLIELFFGNEVAPRGYVWIFPKGDDVANVGIGIVGSSKMNAKAYLDKFLETNPRMKKAEPVELKGGIISVGRSLDEMVGDNFMVVGTAAHQVDPIHGGGMGLAMEAATIAAETALDAWKSKDFSEKKLAPYEEKWKAGAGKKMDKRYKLRKVLEKLSDKDWDTITAELDSNDLDRLLRSDFSPVVKKILAKHPHFLKYLSVLLNI